MHTASSQLKSGGEMQVADDEGEKKRKIGERDDS